MTHEQAIRQFIVGKVYNWLTSDDSLNAEIERRVSESIADDASRGNGCREEYETMLRTGAQRELYADCAGVEVIGVLNEMIDSESSGIAHDLLNDLLDTGDSDQRVMLGELFLPSSADYIDWPDDDEEEDSDDE